MTMPAHPPRRTSVLPIWLLVLLCVAAISALACSTSSKNTKKSDDTQGLKFSFEEGKLPGEPSTRPPTGSTSSSDSVRAEPSQGEKTLPAITAPSQDLQRAKDDLGTIPAPTFETLQRADKAGLPTHTEEQKIAGPFDGPHNSLFYINGEGLVSFYLPNYHAAYFAQAKPFRWVYGVSMAGYFAFDQQNNYLALAQAPEQLLAWPMAYPIAEQIAAFAYAYIEEQQRIEQGAAPSPNLPSHRDLDDLTPKERELFWEEMDQLAKMMDDTNMTIIHNIGGAGCINHYKDAYFIGCY